MQKIIVVIFLFFIANYANAFEKAKFTPNGENILVISEYSYYVLKKETYKYVFAKPNGKTLAFDVEKYKGLTAYIDPNYERKKDNNIKLIIENGDVIYLDRKNYQRGEYSFLIDKNKYDSILQQIKLLKSTPISTVSNITVNTVTTSSKGIWSVILSNGVKLEYEAYIALLKIAEKINNENDFNNFINCFNDEKYPIYVKYDEIDRTFLVSGHQYIPRTPIEMYLKIADGKIAPIISIVYIGDNWAFANKFAIYQEGNKYTSDEVNFTRSYKEFAIESFISILDDNFLNFLKTLDIEKKATVRFYGGHYHFDKEISKGDLISINTIFKVLGILKKYY